MSMTTHERPGVYSDYDASTVVSSTGGGQTVGLAAVCTKGEAGTLYVLNRYEDAVTTFGQEENLTELVRLLLLNGAAQVRAVPVANAEGYEVAFALLEAEEDVALVVCDSTDVSVQQKLRDSVCAASEARRERIAVVCGGASERVDNLVQRAGQINSERVVLLAPGDASSLLAAELGADYLIILTAVEKVAINFGKENQEWLSDLTVDQAKEYIAQEQFAKGSMLPKIEAAIRFAESGEGRRTLITLLDKAASGIAGETGTVIHK